MLAKMFLAHRGPSTRAEALAQDDKLIDDQVPGARGGLNLVISHSFQPME